MREGDYHKKGFIIVFIFYSIIIVFVLITNQELIKVKSHFTTIKNSTAKEITF